jgi:hypothetical protein
MVQEGYGIDAGRSDYDRNGNPIYITGVNSKGWLNVFALKRRDGKTYYRFGYNVNEGRWAYGARPKINEDILNPKRNVAYPTNTFAGLGWRFLGGSVAVIAKIMLFAAQAVVGILVAFLAGLLASGTKRRSRKRWF